MLEFDGKSNLLEQANYKYQLQDVKEPNLYRELYDYESVPKIAFNHRVVPLHMPEEIWINASAYTLVPSNIGSSAGIATWLPDSVAYPPARKISLLFLYTS